MDPQMDPRETGLAPSFLSTPSAFRSASLANFCGLGLFWALQLDPLQLPRTMKKWGASMTAFAG
jgi:hypothetical protein